MKKYKIISNDAVYLGMAMAYGVIMICIIMLFIAGLFLIIFNDTVSVTMIVILMIIYIFANIFIAYKLGNYKTKEYLKEKQKKIDEALKK